MQAYTVRAALTGTTFAEVRVVPETGSTNADVLAMARAGAAEGVVLVADHQSAGRGRLDREWQAPPGSSLLLSVLTRPVTGPIGLTVDELHLVSTALGIAAAEAAGAAAAAVIGLKWPNDLVIDVAHGGLPTRKLGGILAESVLEGSTLQALVVGIGINVNWPELPPDLADAAIALNLVAGRELDREPLLIDLLRRFDHWYGGLATDEGKRALVGRYRTLSATLGHRVRVELPGETIIGDAVDLTMDGHLLVVDDCPDRPREITVGDVVRLRRDS